MITQDDLKQAIAECQGIRRPNADTCIKLAAFYTIQQHLYGDQPPILSGYSETPENQPGEAIAFYTDSDFSRAIDGKPMAKAMQVLDELMEAVNVLNPRLYNATLRKLTEI